MLQELSTKPDLVMIIHSLTKGVWTH